MLNARKRFEQLCDSFDPADVEVEENGRTFYGIFCPHCGWDTEDDYYGDQVICGAESTNISVQQGCGGHPVDWLELWDCPDCGGIFHHESCNY